MGQNFDLLGIPKTHKRLGIDSSSGTDSSSGADSSSGTDSSSGSNSGNSNSNSFIVYIIPIPIPGKNGIKTPLVLTFGENYPFLPIPRLRVFLEVIRKI